MIVKWNLHTQSPNVWKLNMMVGTRARAVVGLQRWALGTGKRGHREENEHNLEVHSIGGAGLVQKTQ